MQNEPFPIPTVPPVLASKDAATARQFSRDLYQDFFNTAIEDTQQVLTSRSASDWQTASEERALHIFHEAANRVPAYKDVLKQANIDPATITTIEDFRKVPILTKDTYLKQYPLEALCWDGNFERSQIVSVSSGSTGQPFLWPREARLELETTYLFELILTSFFHADQRRTLIVDCFAMGMYVGGPFFLNATLRIAQKGYPITVVTPGNVIDDIVRVVKELGPHYEQVVLSGYPPFLKDVIEAGEEAGVNWSAFRTIFFPAGDGFSESWRLKVAGETDSTNPVHDFLSYYGTADAAVLGFETPWSITLRREINRDSKKVRHVFGQDRLPSLLNYIPTVRYFEVINNELHFTTANGTIPLIRYNIGDQGGIFDYDHGQRLISREDGSPSTADPEWQLPYVYVFGRSDHTVILYGANIYPENIKTAIGMGLLSEACTGRFVMSVQEDENLNPRLHIYLECEANTTPSQQFKSYATETIKLILIDTNAEYANALQAVGERATPVVHLRPHADPKYFDRQKKQKWSLDRNSPAKP